jgi:hypothetical protein
MRSSHLHRLKRSTAIAAFLMVGAAAPSLAAATDASVSEVALAQAPAGILKRLPAGKDELTFRGENATRNWTIDLSPSEAAMGSSFQLAMLNAVVVLPERSFLKLTVNGRPLASLPVRSPDKVTTQAVRIPPGVLRPGANKIQISVALTHRVDCSAKATYELWALLDPSRTGVLTEKSNTLAMRSLDELAAEPLAEDGSTRIHVRMANTADPDAISRASRFVNALVRRAGLFRPIVDVGPDVGQGAGFDVVVSGSPDAHETLGQMRILGHENDVTWGRDTAANRLVVVLAGLDEAEFNQRMSELEKGPRPIIQSSADGVVIEAGGRMKFSDLGLSSDNFAGRRFASSASVTLPADFFPASYDKARLLIDGGHSTTLDSTSELFFRVNGAVVSTMWLAAGSSEQFNHRIVELPLRFFHPGHNEIAIEGVLSTAADQQCDVMAAPHDVRLTIAGTSELEFPRFARLMTLPQIPSALASAASNDPNGRLDLYLADGDRGSVGAGLTMLANMATTLGAIHTPSFHLEPPSGEDAPGVVIAPMDQLPGNLALALDKITTEPPVSDTATASKATEAANTLDAQQATQVDGSAQAPQPPIVNVNALLETGRNLLRDGGFFVGGGDRDDGVLTVSDNALLIGAVNPETDEAQTIGGVPVPHVVHSSAQWLVVTGRNASAFESGLDDLIASGQWSALAGQAVTFDPDSPTLHSVQPQRVSYVAPTRIALSDIRPILGSVLSDNILLSLAGLALLMSILGVSTHALVRRMGAR